MTYPIFHSLTHSAVSYLIVNRITAMAETKDSEKQRPPAFDEDEEEKHFRKIVGAFLYYR